MKNISQKFNLDFLEKLPKVECIKCHRIYRREIEKNYICYECNEKAEYQREVDMKKKEKTEYLLNNSNIPKRYKKAEFKSKGEIQKTVSDYLTKNFLENDFEVTSDILLFGSLGTGKTYLSCGFAINLIQKKNIDIKYITEYQLLSLYFQKEYISFTNFRDADILILDEIGKRVLIDWQMIQLEELLSHRFNEMLPTIYISNLTEKQFKTFLGDRLRGEIIGSFLISFIKLFISLCIVLFTIFIINNSKSAKLIFPFLLNSLAWGCRFLLQFFNHLF